MLNLFKKLRAQTFSLRFCILAVFIVLFILAFALLSGVTYTRFSSAMSHVATMMMRNVSNSIVYTIEREVNVAVSESRFGAEMIKQNVLDANSYHELIEYTAAAVKDMPIAQAIYWGDSQGNFVIAEKQANNTIVSEIIDRKKKTHTRMLINKNWQGEKLNQVNSNDLSYDPRQRPWYQKAQITHGTAWTDIYLFKPSNILGITVSTPVYADNGELRGVFAVDIRLDFLYQFIAEQHMGKHACIYLVTDNGELILMSTFEEQFNPVFSSNTL